MAITADLNDTVENGAILVKENKKQVELEELFQKASDIQADFSRGKAELEAMTRQEMFPDIANWKLRYAKLHILDCFHFHCQET